MLFFIIACIRLLYEKQIVIRFLCLVSDDLFRYLHFRYVFPGKVTTVHTVRTEACIAGIHLPKVVHVQNL